MRPFVILVFTFLLSFVANSQELQWIIKPTITDVDEIAVHNTAEPLVRVKKGYLYGVKNLNDQLIIPIEHKELNISLNQKYIYSGKINSRGTSVHTITTKGDTLKTSFKAPHEKLWKETNRETKKALAKFAMENDLKVIEYENEEGRICFNLTDKNNKFTIDSITSARPLGKELIFLMINHQKGYVYDRFGHIVYHDSKVLYLKTNGKGLYVGHGIVLDTDFKVIFKTLQKKYLKLLEKYPLFTIRSNQNGKLSGRLVNEKGETVLSGTFSIMEQSNTNFLRLKDEKGYHYYSLKEKKMLYHSKDPISPTIIDDYVQISSKVDGKNNYRIYDFVKKKFVIDTIYQSVLMRPNFIIAKKYENRKITESVLFDIRGEERLRFSNEELEPLIDDHYLVSNRDEINRMIDGEGKTVFEVDDVYILERVDDKWLRTRDVRRNYTYYLVKDIVAGNINPYESLVAFENKKLTKTGPYIVKKKEKYGLMSSECDFILDCVFDKLLFTVLPDKKTSEKHSDVISVLENGKWGAFVVPGLE